MTQNLATTDFSIRAPLLLWLRRLYSDDLSAKMLEEFKMPRPSARIDIALVNGEMAGYEIKSDRDNLRRLKVQIPAYAKVFDKVSLVTTAKHLEEAEAKVPHWWGILVFDDAGQFRIARASKQNKGVDVRALLFALSRNELLQVARMANVSLYRLGRKEEMVDALSSATTSRAMFNYAREVLKLRRAG